MEFFSNHKPFFILLLISLLGSPACGGESDEVDEGLTGLEAFYNKPGGGTPIGPAASGDAGSTTTPGGEASGEGGSETTEGGESSDLCGDQECGGPCGVCTDELVCIEGKCVDPPCEPQCEDNNLDIQVAIA